MARTLVAALIAMLGGLAWAGAAPAQAAAPTLPSPTSAAREAPAPAWHQLSADQRQVLAPLAAQWNQMPARQRRHLILVANKYPKMTPIEQRRVQERLTEWARLSPQERQIARERYRKLKQLPPEKHQEVKKKWEQYQAQKLPPDRDPPQPYVVDGGSDQ